MNSELIFVGRRIPMATKSRRRALVVLVYSGLLLSLAGFWWFFRAQAGPYFLLMPAQLGRALMGGYGGEGVVKKFFPRLRRSQRSQLAQLNLGPAPMRMLSDPNDERELQQRDHVHTIAYRVIALFVLMVWAVVQFCALSGIEVPVTKEQMAGIVLPGVIALMMTLPQAILLWNEPDVEGAE